MLKVFILTLKFDLYVILIGQSKGFCTKWSEVSTIHGSKVVSGYIEIKKLSGTLNARRGLWILSVYIN